MNLVLKLGRGLTVFGMATLLHLAFAQGRPQGPPNFAKFKADIATCNSHADDLGYTGVALPIPSEGERPAQMGDQQKALIQACQQAGYIPNFHHGPPPGEDQ